MMLLVTFGLLFDVSLEKSNFPHCYILKIGTTCNFSLNIQYLKPKKSYFLSKDTSKVHQQMSFGVIQVKDNLTNFKTEQGKILI